MAKTKIEWAEHTWNPVVGCTRVSEGCRNCYAESMSTRLAANPKTPQYDGIAEGGKWTGVVRLVEHALDEPLRRKVPTRYFVCSMSDLFHERCENEWIAAVFGVMAACPQHEFLILTKRPERMRSWCQEDWTGPHPDGYYDPVNDCLSFAAHHLGDGSGDDQERWFGDLWNRSGGADQHPWPLPNVWLGTSVENQATADQRIPHLLATPAAKRFISAEPLLDSVDFSRWSIPQAPVKDPPESWADFHWPDWVPTKTRDQIKSFWSWHRTPADYIENCRQPGAPPFGARFRYEGGAMGECEGRWVHCWNNIGRLVGDDGVPRFASFGSGGLFDFRAGRNNGLDLVIVGGESGPGARPMHPDWARSIRDQCVEAGVEFFFKQWGEWAPYDHDGQNVRNYKLSMNRFRYETQCWTPSGETYDARNPGDWVGSTTVYRIGKKRAGRLLDGEIHDGGLS